MDEPTTGLHMADIERLLAALQALVDHGNTVAVIEHNADVIKVADHIIDMGPEGGEAGGFLVGSGTPKEIAKLDTATGAVLRDALGEALPIRSPDPEVVATSTHHKDIRLKGTRHNIKGIDVTFPHGKMTVVTGVSGSGKTSLAFHTLFAEGQRRYVEPLDIRATIPRSSGPRTSR